LFPFTDRFRPLSMRLSCAVVLLLVLFCASCKRSGPVGSGEVMYVSAPQANLRDHVATVYNRVGSVKNGDRVEVLERQRRFVRVRTDQKVEGWIELRALVPRETFDQFQQLVKENRTTPVEGHGITLAPTDSSEPARVVLADPNCLAAAIQSGADQILVAGELLDGIGDRDRHGVAGRQGASGSTVYRGHRLPGGGRVGRRGVNS